MFDTTEEKLSEIPTVCNTTAVMGELFYYVNVVTPSVKQRC